MEQFTSACLIVVNTFRDFTENLAMLRVLSGFMPPWFSEAQHVDAPFDKENEIILCPHIPRGHGTDLAVGTRPRPGGYRR
jgi:hypothetical protein